MRFGSAEIYDVIEQCFAPAATHAPHTVVDCLAVGQSVAGGTDERVILFVKLLEGQVLTEELEKRIRSEGRARRSARHVPARVSTITSGSRSARVGVSREGCASLAPPRSRGTLLTRG